MLTLNNEEINNSFLIAGFSRHGVEGQWRYNCSPFTLAQAGEMLKEEDVTISLNPGAEYSNAFCIPWFVRLCLTVTETEKLL